nr:hypothetical protein BaRGS_010958 [Batillaria attramentaria]
MSGYTTLWTSSSDKEFRELSKHHSLQKRRLGLRMTGIEREHVRQVRRVRTEMREATGLVEQYEKEKEQPELERLNLVIREYLLFIYGKDGALPPIQSTARRGSSSSVSSSGGHSDRRSTRTAGRLSDTGRPSLGDIAENSTLDHNASAQNGADDISDNVGETVCPRYSLFLRYEHYKVYPEAKPRPSLHNLGKVKQEGKPVEEKKVTFRSLAKTLAPQKSAMEEKVGMLRTHKSFAYLLKERVLPQVAAASAQIGEGGEDQEPDYMQVVPNLKADVIDRIGELLAELEGGIENVATQALEHIHANETIMTFGKSQTVEAFLKNAARKRKFQVIVAEAAPYFKGQEMVSSLADADIETTLISDASIFAMMSRVNKVIIGTHTIMANGGLKALCGILNVALAAKQFAVPVFVCASVYKLSPQFVTSVDQEGFQKYNSPHHILSYKEMAELDDVEC